MKNTTLIYSSIIGATLLVGILLSGGQNLSQTFAFFHEGEEQDTADNQTGGAFDNQTGGAFDNQTGGAFDNQTGGAFDNQTG
jgi:hypothetical protein